MTVATKVQSRIKGGHKVAFFCARGLRRALALMTIGIKCALLKARGERERQQWGGCWTLMPAKTPKHC